MTETASQITPDQELAAVIASALVTGKLISPQKQGELEKRLSTGTITQEDWRLLIEMPLMKESKEEEQSHDKAD